uniref:Cyclic GMP-AMP synthase n=1 Tax=Otolemur garnettii TaxID=30611 RepID=H0X9J7_OTOGA
MDRRRGKATPAAPKAGAAVPKASARSSRGSPTEASEPPAAPKVAQPRAGRCGAGGESGARRKQSAPTEASEPPAAPKAAQIRAGRARAEKAAPSAEELEGRGAAAAEVDSSMSPGTTPRRAASLREGGARRTRERRSPLGSAKDPSCSLALSAASAGGPKAAPGAWKLRGVLDQLRLRAPDISAAAYVVNRVVKHLLDSLRRGESEFKGVALLGTGSYYEHVKISAPNEFDVMFKLEVPRIELEEYGNSGTHYFVKFKRNPKENPLNPFLEKEKLSASKMLLKFRTIIKEEIKNIKDADVTMERKKRGSPAVTLLIRNEPEEISVDIILALESRSSWPAGTQEGMPIKDWLGAKVRTKLRQQPFYLVPKPAKEGNGFQEETWRLSFSHIEKAILNNHGHTKTCCEDGGVKCCRKDCLKLMKYLLEQLKKKYETRKVLDKFCSYHMKTAFFHVCTQNPDDSQWCPQKLQLCFDNCVLYFLQCLRNEQLKHYFIPEVNLFSQEQIDKKSIEFLSKQIESEINNRFPVFGEY